MKKILLGISILSSTLALAQTTTKYDGNGKNGFGGSVGQGYFEITDKGDSVCFLLTKGTAAFDSLLVFYVDGIDGGITTTANLSAGTDLYSTAVTGHYSATEKSVLNFPVGFQPDFSVVFNKDGGRIFFFEKDTQGNDIIMPGADVALTPTGTSSSPIYSGTIAKADVSVSGPVSFKLIGTYIGPKASRSNEGFGDPFEAFDFNSYADYTTAAYLNYSSASSLPVSLVNLRALALNGKIQVNWTVVQETNIDEYEIQRSLNGIQFSTIATVKANNASNSITYTSNDNNAQKGMNYYRIIIKEKGRSEISRVVSINNGVDRKNFQVHQRGNSLNIKFNGLSAAAYKLSIINSNGQLLQSENIQYNGTDYSRNINIKGNAVKGIYRVVLQSEKVNLVQSILLQ